MAKLPKCGVYRTSKPLSDAVPAGRLVYFHNHGDPGPGIYLPDGWTANRAQWEPSGHPIPSAAWAQSLEALPDEGLYRVHAAFACCEQECRIFEEDLLVQLGYDEEAQPLLFVPEWTASGLALPELGTAIDTERISCLTPLKVVEGDDDEPNGTLH